MSYIFHLNFNLFFPVFNLFQLVVQTSPSLSCNEKTLLHVFALKWKKDGNLCSPSQEKETEKQIWLSHFSALAANSVKVIEEKKHSTFSME